MTTMTTQQVQNRKKQPSLAFRMRPCLEITSRQNAKALAAPKHEPWGRALRDLHCDTKPMLSEHPIYSRGTLLASASFTCPFL